MKRQDVLFDVHGCLADFTGGCVELLNLNFPDLNWSKEHVVNWDFWDDIPNQEAVRYLLDQMTKFSFISNLPAINEAIVVYEHLLDVGHKVTICTTPLGGKNELSSMRAVTQWVKFYLGKQAAERMVFSFDKTQIPADVIIDDKPLLTVNKSNIRFRHWLIVDHPYNQKLPEESSLLPIGRINNDWTNWKEELEKLELI